MNSASPSQVALLRPRQRDVQTSGKQKISAAHPFMILWQDVGVSDLTLLLQQAASGDAASQERVLDLLYGELHKMAEIALRGERAEHTLQATALVHEAYLRLFGAHQVEWQSRQHFFVTASRTIRRILVDYARKHNSEKRGGLAARVDFENAMVVARSYSREFIELDRALEELSNVDNRKSQVVEMRFFGGMTMDEIASVLSVSENTVKRDWTIARAWLQSRIDEPAGV